jgi:glycosyltransferase involved in cell wall biosynthesis
MTDASGSTLQRRSIRSLDKSGDHLAADPININYMDISLIICTRDRCHKLARCLEAVRYITCDRPWELIVVDNGSTDETAGVVREFIKTIKLPAIYLFEGLRGKSNGLNTAIKAANGQILAFTDDDCYPAPDFLNAIWSAFDASSVGYIGGRIILHDPADYPIVVDGSMTPVTFPAGSFVCAGSVQGANMAFRRRVLFDIGGFDPLLGPGAFFTAAEDIDAVGRASAMGWRGEYHPEVIVKHHHGRKAADAAALWKSYAIGRGAYHMKLLLTGHQYSWFARSIYQLRWRYKTSRTTLLWELAGAAAYVYVCLTQILQSRLGNPVRR